MKDCIRKKINFLKSISYAKKSELLNIIQQKNLFLI